MKLANFGAILGVSRLKSAKLLGQPTLLLSELRKINYAATLQPDPNNIFAEDPRHVCAHRI